MPLYEYKCAKCGEVFELIQKFSDEPLHEHPGCGGPVEKLVSASALQFKGSGWYVNDYGKSNSGGKDKGKNESSDHKKSSDAGKDSGKDSSKTEKSDTAKPAATPAKEASTPTKSA